MESLIRFVIILLFTFKMVNKVIAAAMLNVTCDNERNNIMAGQPGSVILLRCCSEYFMCQCLEKRCQGGNNNDVWCVYIKKHPCKIEPECYHKHVVTIDNDGNSPECDVFKSNWRNWLLTFIIYMSTFVAAGIIILIFLVGYKKLKAYYQMKKRKRRTEIRFSLATTPNVDSVVVVDKYRKSKSKSRSRSLSGGIGTSKTTSESQARTQPQNNKSNERSKAMNRQTTMADNTTTTIGERQPYSISFERNSMPQKTVATTGKGKKITQSYLVKALM
uniref:Uncharacterized protein LOC113799658 n=2 Tax=Dermatophagoides pteronyssinus TaxID=6956 RepID=A0A6P6YKQ6_DERPT|nr:uncharacterized protein LOC113799658 [Dermatophagoides pteronyssinus]